MEPSVVSLQILGGRICHDLAAPIGALSMGLEMLRDHDLTPAQQEVLNLVEQSLSSARTKLELFRFLVGYKQSEERPILNEITPYLQKLWENSRYTFHSNGCEAVKGLHARLALALVLAGSECLPRGGELALIYSAPKLYISVTGHQASLGEEAQALFRANPLPHQANDVFAWYAQAVALRLGVRIEYAQDGLEHFTLTAQV